MCSCFYFFAFFFDRDFVACSVGRYNSGDTVGVIVVVGGSAAGQRGGYRRMGVM